MNFWPLTRNSRPCSCSHCSIWAFSFFSSWSNTHTSQHKLAIPLLVNEVLRPLVWGHPHPISRLLDVALLNNARDCQALVMLLLPADMVRKHEYFSTLGRLFCKSERCFSSFKRFPPRLVNREGSVAFFYWFKYRPRRTDREPNNNLLKKIYKQTKQQQENKKNFYPWHKIKVVEMHNWGTQKNTKHNKQIINLTSKSKKSFQLSSHL